uniref:CCHC-type domain-containing protein n=1 Tax=Strigamia maritima TaxID=126957 RepID=T1IJH0_STRMM
MSSEAVQAFSSKSKVTDSKTSADGSYLQKITCFKCNQQGHFARDCVENASVSQDTSYLDSGTCYTCGKTGHMSRQCPDGYAPRGGRPFRSPGRGRSSRRGGNTPGQPSSNVTSAWFAKVVDSGPVSVHPMVCSAKVNGAGKLDGGLYRVQGAIQYRNSNKKELSSGTCGLEAHTTSKVKNVCENAQLWHKRFAHVDVNDLKRLNGDLTRMSVNSKNEVVTSKPLELIRIGVWGPTKTKSLVGPSHLNTVMRCYQFFQKFHLRVEKLSGFKVKSVSLEKWYPNLYIKGQIPYVLWRDRVLSMGHIRVLGSLVSAKNPKAYDGVGSFKKGYLVGYAMRKMDYRVWDPNSNVIYELNKVVCNERELFGNTRKTSNIQTEGNQEVEPYHDPGVSSDSEDDDVTPSAPITKPRCQLRR